MKNLSIAKRKLIEIGLEKLDVFESEGEILATYCSASYLRALKDKEFNYGYALYFFDEEKHEWDTYGMGTGERRKYNGKN